MSHPWIRRKLRCGRPSLLSIAENESQSELGHYRLVPLVVPVTLMGHHVCGYFAGRY